MNIFNLLKLASKLDKQGKFRTSDSVLKIVKAQADDFDFSKEDFTIYAGGTYNLALTPQYINNQTFRIVIVPGFFAKSLKDTDYFSVMKALKLNESKVQNVKF